MSPESGAGLQGAGLGAGLGAGHGAGLGAGLGTGLPNGLNLGLGQQGKRGNKNYEYVNELLYCWLRSHLLKMFMNKEFKYYTYNNLCQEPFIK